MGFKMTYNKIRFYLSFLLLGFYLVVGGMFLFTEIWADLLPQGRYTIGIILVLFGGIRFYIAYRRYSNKTVVLRTKEEEKKNATE